MEVNKNEEELLSVYSAEVKQLHVLEAHYYDCERNLKRARSDYELAEVQVKDQEQTVKFARKNAFSAAKTLKDAIVAEKKRLEEKELVVESILSQCSSEEEEEETVKKEEEEIKVKKEEKVEEKEEEQGEKAFSSEFSRLSLEDKRYWDDASISGDEENSVWSEDESDDNGTDLEDFIEDDLAEWEEEEEEGEGEEKEEVKEGEEEVEKGEEGEEEEEGKQGKEDDDEFSIDEGELTLEEREQLEAFRWLHSYCDRLRKGFIRKE